MKKIIMMLFAAIFSIGVAVADGNVCRTSDGKVTLVWSNLQSDENGEVCPSLEYNAPADSKTASVLVICYDAVTGKMVTKRSTFISGGQTDGVCFRKGDGIMPDHAYIFKIELC